MPAQRGSRGLSGESTVYTEDHQALQAGYAILAAITQSGLEMEISLDRKQGLLRQWLQDGEARPGPEWRKISRLTAAAALVFDRAGAPNAKVSLQDLWAAGEELTTLAAMIRDPGSVTGATFTTRPDIEIPRPEPIRMVLGHSFNVGEFVIAYGARAEASGRESESEADIIWSSGALVFLGLKRVASARQFFAFLDGLPQEPFRVLTGVYQAKRSDCPASIQAAATPAPRPVKGTGSGGVSVRSAPADRGARHRSSVGASVKP